MKIADSFDKKGYKRRYASLTKDGDPLKGRTISLYGEEYGIEPEVANMVFDAGYVTPNDWFKSGIHQTLVNALRKITGDEKSACKIEADRIIRMIREDIIYGK